MRLQKVPDIAQGLSLYVKYGGEFAGVCDRDGNEIIGVKSFEIDQSDYDNPIMTLKVALVTRRDKPEG